ncbi:uncharacterized protein EV422DRAFT_536819 [Fimicolochytrium jonesii]|uniref:uncharacterized protein n=1 Tax=Fimicolochytrium jonesii TaxID=1396493 RepID=UPI0022FF27E3|nr:uncharacterized protein EV422DRAFT_536819 [Fimicolochytrium jonesii]KAI8818783.1 hypothetical protein EV422DRAFT_536819 [Fimicolochytrium jonesii]
MKLKSIKLCVPAPCAAFATPGAAVHNGEAVTHVDMMYEGLQGNSFAMQLRSLVRRDVGPNGRLIGNRQRTQSYTQAGLVTVSDVFEWTETGGRAFQTDVPPWAVMITRTNGYVRTVGRS